jgi:flagellin
MVALDALDATNSQLNSVQKQISTGYRVADAVDDGAAYAVAQSVRSSVGALTTANQQLGSAQGLLSTTSSALNDVSNIMSSMRDVLVNLASSAITGNERSQYESQYASLTANVKSFVQDSIYNGQSLIGNINNSAGALPAAYGGISVVRNEVGTAYTVGAFDASTAYHAISFGGVGSTTLASATQVAALITAGGTFITQANSVSTEMNTYGAATNFINNQVSYNSDKINSLNAGLGSLVDANLAQESALLQALQIKQQLATQSLTLADQTPQILLSLVKGA